MHARFRAQLLAGAILFSAAPFVVPLTPAMAQVEFDISFDSFHDQLDSYGAWVYSDRWGTVWMPEDVPDDFRPYDTGGHWVYTDDYGWMWASDYPWGDITFHYGRWVDDPDDGWLWIPGYTWSPGWVVWRSNGEYVGWMPMPPDEDYLDNGEDVGGGGFGVGISFSWGGDPMYGYRTWYGSDYGEDRFAQNWVFVGIGHMDDPHFHRDEVRDPGRVVNIIHQTTNITNYTVINNYVVNKSVNVQQVQRAAGHPIQAVPASQVIKHPQLVASVTTGRQATARWHAAVPVGHGVANSAPPPTAAVVQKLSTHVKPHAGHAPVHLFTKTTVTAPAAASHFKGTPPHGGPAQPMMHKENTQNGGQPATPSTPAQPMMHKENTQNGGQSATPSTPAQPMTHHENVQQGGQGNAPTTEHHGHVPATVTTPESNPPSGTENRTLEERRATHHTPATEMTPNTTPSTMEHAPPPPVEHHAPPPEVVHHAPPPEVEHHAPPPEVVHHAPPPESSRGHENPPREEKGKPKKGEKNNENPQ
ncbi:MAG: hypothetical protein KGJ78_05660 [Alphaproteobacteria bacterium]|nr:hypothetical protein [Alphaproteobacteria bacterium]